MRGAVTSTGTLRDATRGREGDGKKTRRNRSPVGQPAGFKIKVRFAVGVALFQKKAAPIVIQNVKTRRFLHGCLLSPLFIDAIPYSTVWGASGSETLKCQTPTL